ncbi:hypothetical protein [Streptomyces erythrochromogenes]
MSLLRSVRRVRRRLAELLCCGACVTLHARGIDAHGFDAAATARGRAR